MEGSNEEPLRIILLGKTGNGKSSTGNTILGSEIYRAEPSFSTVTSECRRETTVINCRRIEVVDTPGLCDTHAPTEDVAQEVRRSVSVVSPGPIVFLFHLRMNDHFTEEDLHVYQLVKALFGENITRHTIVVFTHADQCKDRDIVELLRTAPQQMKKLLEDCDHRYLLMDNERPSESQVQTLLDMTQKLLQQQTRADDNCAQPAHKQPDITMTHSARPRKSASKARTLLDSSGAKTERKQSETEKKIRMAWNKDAWMNGLLRFHRQFFGFAVVGMVYTAHGSEVTTCNATVYDGSATISCNFENSQRMKEDIIIQKLHNGPSSDDFPDILLHCYWDEYLNYTKCSAERSGCEADEGYGVRIKPVVDRDEGQYVCQKLPAAHFHFQPCTLSLSDDTAVGKQQANISGETSDTSSVNQPLVTWRTAYGIFAIAVASVGAIQIVVILIIVTSVGFKGKNTCCRTRYFKDNQQTKRETDNMLLNI